MRPHDHWTRTSHAIESSIARAHRVTTLQQSAAMQLDSASYAFAELLADLATAMPLPQMKLAPVVASIGPRPLHKTAMQSVARAA